MIINICGSSSSGNTFLSYLLNRHPGVVCGNELSLFSKPILYDSYDHFRKMWFIIKKTGISSNPYHPDTAIFRNLRTYQLNHDIVSSWVKQSKNIVDLAGMFERHIQGLTGKQNWAEKTPSNIYVSGTFLKHFPDAKMIHMVRDPRDVMLSIMDRGYSLNEAAETWLTSVACVRNHRGHPNVLEVKYEDLILHKEETLNRICRHLSIEYKMNFFTEDQYESKGLEKSEKWDSWGSDPSREFSDRSIRKYANNPVDFRPVMSMKLSPEFAALIDTEPVTLRTLMEQYGYPTDGLGQQDSEKKLPWPGTGRRTFKNRLGTMARQCLVEKKESIQRVAAL